MCLKQTKVRVFACEDTCDNLEERGRKLKESDGGKALTGSGATGDQ